ncbi:MAG: hypothetical protein QXH32_02140 [Candidatus Caldarchaeum sp.]
MAQTNKIEEVYNEKPWTRGLVEALKGVKIIRNSKLETRNRLALILLDSILEIAFKHFLIYERNIELDKKMPYLCIEINSTTKCVKRHNLFLMKIYGRK